MTEQTAPDTVPSPIHAWGYAFTWALIGLAIGFGTYLAVVTNPAVAPADREAIESGLPSARDVTASEVKIRAIDPESNAVRWQLSVPVTHGGIASTSTFDAPEIVLYPGGREFLITASQGLLKEAPGGAAHTSGNARLELIGPIHGENPDGSERFDADHADWDGRIEQLILEGSPLTLERAGMTIKSKRLVVTFTQGGTPTYVLSGGVDVQGTGK